MPMPAPEIIHQLVAKFEENREAYRSGKYNEARLRQEFLDPFFEALGWDVYNKSGLAPEYAEVAVEDSLDIEGTSKAPDYAFKVGRERKFYVEAKKPKVDIQYDIHPAFQLRRYAWNAHLPLSVLTDFEEFAIYNCKNKPNPTDSAATGRELFYRYTDYVDKWDEIAAVLSKDAVWKGAFDRYADTSKGKKGTTEVDDEFLKDMSDWRNALARNIALRNPQVADEAQLNYAVQMTIDRIIFLRICEDRGIEAEEQLKTIAQQAGIYAQLVELFKRADVRYNSGLFHFHKEKGNGNAADTFTPGLKIDDKVLKEIISSIYYPCPYIFKEIPVEILGQVYEQFLGKVIRLTAGHQAKVEEKPEVRKAGGVYYTPRYIVDYIVQNTVGKLLEGRAPEEAAKLKIVDPACGSGSFLLGAYQHLLDWHLKWYTENDAERWAKGRNPALVQVTGGWKLTTEKKKEILVNNIHGVDIDAQAVEVTKLSLLLKVLEEESGQLSLGFERVLPDLGKNIQCGNSLIGEDYFEGRLTVDLEERRRVNPFEWQRAFPEVFQQGGFDAVIGNPPYVRIQTMKEWANGEVAFFPSKYESAVKGNYDLYCLFIEKGLSLLRQSGTLSFIIGSKWLLANYADNFRNLIGNYVNEIIDFRFNQIFENAFVNTIVIKFSKTPISNATRFIILPTSNVETNVRRILTKDFSESVQVQEFNPRELSFKPWHFTQKNIEEFINRIESNNTTLENISERIYQGLKTSSDNIFLVKVENQYDRKVIIRSKEFNSTFEVESDLFKTLYRGSQVKKYKLIEEERAILFPYENKVLLSEDQLREKYPQTYTYLLANKKALESREHGIFKGKNWFCFGRTQAIEIIERPKILTPDLAKSVSFAFDQDGHAYFIGGAAGGYGIILRPEWNYYYVLGLLNSKLIDCLIKQHTTQMESGFYSFEARFIRSTPIHQIDFSNLRETSNHDQIVILVKRILELNKLTPITPQEKEHVAREIEATDRQIDRLVYELYGLTEEEIRIVEGKT